MSIAMELEVGLLSEKKFADYYPKGKWKTVPVSVVKKDLALAKEILDRVNTAYASIGGHAKIRSVQDVAKEAAIIHAIDLDDDPEMDAVSLAKKKPAGHKSIGLGHDGSGAAKKAVLKHKAAEMKAGKLYGEVSGAMAHILLTKHGIPSVNDAEKVKKILRKDIEWVGAHPDGKYPKNPGWYRRKIGGKVHMKILVGFPKGA